MEQIWEGTLQKMRVAATSPVSYWLEDALQASDAPSANDLPVNALLGRPVELRFEGRLTCLACNKEVERVFDNGYCEICVRTRADADICMMRPERCHYGDPDNPCRDDSFAIERCFQPHYLYASLTSDVKIGITRASNVPARWMDQGAVAAITLARLPSRREVGLVEHALAASFKDRTHWMNMLRGTPDPALLDLAVAEIDQRLAELGVSGVLPPEQRLRMTFQYPMNVSLEKVKRLTFRRASRLQGVLLGVKGQYWVLDQGVLNVRRHSGYGVEVLAGR